MSAPMAKILSTLLTHKFKGSKFFVSWSGDKYVIQFNDVAGYGELAIASQVRTTVKKTPYTIINRTPAIKPKEEA